jgi:predicted AlkP superfamily phosphohydrolase/phosphomutase
MLLLSLIYIIGIFYTFMALLPDACDGFQSNRKVLVLGLDGASLKIIGPMVSKGRLPNIAKLMSEGSSGILESTLPPVTIPAWVSMFTGKNPGKLGVFDLLKRNGYGVEPNGYCYCGNAPIWQILNMYDISTGVLNLPGTYPPEKVNGFMVTGMMTPSKRSGFSYPSSLGTDLDSNVSQYEIDVPQWQYFDKGRFLKDIYKVTEKRGRAAEYLVEKFPCDFNMIVFTSSDRLQHVLWKRRDLIESYWEELDRILGRLLPRFSEDSYILIVSDHGFGPLMRTFYVNEWLQRRGYLRIKHQNNERLFVKGGRLIERIYRFLGKKRLLRPILDSLKKYMGVDRLMKYTYTYLSNEKLEGKVDWARTKAFSCVHTPHFGHIYINLEGRMKHGCVPNEEREKLCQAIIDELKNLADPFTGDRVIVEAYKAEELYSGPYLEEAPDLVFIVEDGRYEVDAQVGSDTLFDAGAPSTGWTGTHTRDGIIIAKGPGIKLDYKIQKAKILDVAPTLLHLFGIPIPVDMDGTILSEIFNEDIEFKESEALKPSGDKKATNFCFDEEEKALIERRLRKLGYLT